MSFVARELERLSRALHADPESDRYAEIYAAQQALSWVLEPDGFSSPYAAIMGIREDSEGCQGCPDPLPS